MNSDIPAAPVGVVPEVPMQSAGTLLREARLARGLDLLEVATQLKVPVRKLEALEEDRHAELQGPAFVRALAQAACRAMKVDSAPILACLPQMKMQYEGLENVNTGLNSPFHDAASSRSLMGGLRRQRVVLAWMLVFVVAALVLWALPSNWLERVRTVVPSGAASASAASATTEALPDPIPAPPVAPIASDRLPPVTAASGAASASALMSESLVRPAPVAASAGASASAAASGVAAPAALAASRTAAADALLRLSVRQASWVGVQDAAGKPLLSRVIAVGEKVDVQGALPLKVRIGNVAATEVVFRGKPVNLAEVARDNVASLQLK